MHWVIFSSHDLLCWRSTESPKVWVELGVLIQKYFISFFKNATGLGHLWINWGPSKRARIDPSNLQKTEALQGLWELCLHPRCAHVLPFYYKSKGMLMECRIPFKESNSPPRKQGNFSVSAHIDSQLGHGVWPQLQESGKTWPALTVQELQNTRAILHLAKSEHPISSD